ncbi:MAG: hypothetical protein AAFR73_02800 [Pseudomonadota bacterium]
MKVSEWQLVLVCWGTKYGVNDINRSHAAARRNSGRHVRTVLITDRERPRLSDGISAVPFPDAFKDEAFRGPGCQAKLAMFSDIVPDDMPAVFTDLDSLILGDLADVLSDMWSETDLMILQSTLLPARSVTRALCRLTGGKVYARGNSSIVGYHPKHNRAIAARFLESYRQFGMSFKPNRADERFMSWVAQDRLRFADPAKAVKFTREFMAMNVAHVLRRTASAARRARRARLLFVTLNQDVLKPDRLLKAEEGEVIRDRRGRTTEWSVAALGPFRKVIQDYFA